MNGWPMLLYRTAFSLLLCTILGACAAVMERTDNAGKPLVISQQVANGYRNFRTDPAAGFFTITDDGQGYTTTLCTQQGGCPASRLSPALSDCALRTQSSCKLLGTGKELLWTYRAALKPAEEAATLCFGALVPDKALLQYMMAVEKGMPDAGSSHCGESLAALESGSARFGPAAKNGLTGTAGEYRVETRDGDWRHVTGTLDILGFSARIDGWVKSGQGRLVLFRSTATGEIGAEIGPIFLSRQDLI